MPLLDTVYEFSIGPNIAGLVNVETLLGYPPHPWEYHDTAVAYVAGDGHTYGDGLPQVVWNFPSLTVAAWQTLVGWFGTAQSVTRTIRTKSSDDTYVNKACIMHKPRLGETARRGLGGYFDVVLRFTHLSTAS